MTPNSAKTAQNTKPQRLKAFRAVSACDTIARIRKILHQNNMFVREIYSRDHPDSGTSSCRIILDGENELGQLDIGTNGKGMNSLLSLASGYAEFVERLQNKHLFGKFGYYLQRKMLEEDKYGAYGSAFLRKISENRLQLDFPDYPDEEPVDVHLYLKKDTPFSSHLKSQKPVVKFLKESITHNISLACVPFYEVITDQIEQIPLHLLRLCSGSNGMCAGNTAKESLIQGICEIFERHAMRELYERDLTPPDIPRELLNGAGVLEKIQKIEKDFNTTVLIKDMSLGVGLPVAGCVFIYHDSDTYNVCIGSDANPITAVERCLTEAYQGMNGKGDREQPVHHLRSDDDDKLDNFRRNLTFLDSHWPKSLFSSEPSWQFTGFLHPVSTSDDDDLNYLVHLIREKGWHLYVRDVSFMGFPAFKIHIPEIGDINNWQELEWRLSMKDSLTLLNVRQSSTEDLKNAAESLEKSSQSPTFQFQSIFPPHINQELKSLSFNYFMALLSYRIGNPGRAFSYMDRYMREREETSGTFDKKSYMLCIREFFKMRADNYRFSRIEKELPLLYGKKMGEMVLDAFSIPAHIFNSLKLPSCFQCSDCNIKDDCRFFDIQAIEKNIQDIQQKNPIDQNRLRNVFRT